MKIPKYITSISLSDLKEIAAVTNLTAGDGIIIEKKDDRLIVSLDLEALKSMMLSFYRNGGQSVSYENLGSIPLERTQA